MKLRLLGIIFSFLCLVVLSRAESQTQDASLDEQIAEKVGQLEAELGKTKDPRLREIIQETIQQARRGELTVTRPLTEADRWHLIAIQFSPESGTTVETQELNRFRTGRDGTMILTRTSSPDGFAVRSKTVTKQNGQPDTTSTSWYEVTIPTPPPTSLRPGEFFELSARVEGTFKPDLKFFKTRGSGIEIQRKLDLLKHIAAGDEPLSKTLSVADGVTVTETTYRLQFPQANLPLYARYGIATSDHKQRIVFVYKLNGRTQSNLKFAAFDANPQYNFSELPSELRPSQLIKSAQQRAGTTADGVSQLILRAEISGGVPVKFQLDDQNDGRLTPLLNGRTVTIGDRNYSFALYTPPDVFSSNAGERPKSLFHPDVQPKQRLENVLEYRDVKVAVVSTDGSLRETLSFQLARPPVVLVHGFTSDAYNCWVATKEYGTSMTVLLEKAGIMPFVVNYEKSNGTPVTASAGSSFAANKDVVWDRADPFEYKPIYEGWLVRKEIQPILGDFQRAKPKRIGGIKQAVQHYRQSLNLAATQADVIGHSMGGLLARVYASDEMNPDYKRPENFNRGDIHRLITINTPHFGSELAHLHNALLKGSVDNESWTDWGIRMVPNAVAWMAGVDSPAARDLAAPITGDEPSALKRIGYTRIPSFAITTEANHEKLLTPEYDKHLLYRSMFGTVGMVFFYNRPLLTDFARTRGTQWLEAPEKLRIQNSSVAETNPVALNSETAIDDYAATINRNMESDVYYWMLRRESEYVQRQAKELAKTKIYNPGLVDVDRNEDEDPKSRSIPGTIFDGLSTLAIGGRISVLSDLTSEPDVPSIAIAQIRDLVFHNDHRNDGAVRVISQQGGLKEPHTHNFEGVLHSFAPWHYLVQKQVIELLKWDENLFNPEGFPEAGQLMPRYLPSQRATTARVEGELAVRWSGVVPSHAHAYMEVADEMDAVILVRPVNQDSTKLIAADNATKAMAIKGKSSNWGPQTGFIPVQQRYSKLWMVHKDNPAVRDSKIASFDKVTKDMLGKKHPDKKERYYALSRPLKVKVDEDEYRVLVDPDRERVNDAEKEIYLFAANKYYDILYKDVSSLVSSELASVLQGNPMMVLADGVMDGAEVKDPPLYLTADYDLLAIGMYEEAGFEHGKPDAIDDVDLDKLLGYVLPEQVKIIDALNDAVKKRANYKGGKVTHHGPEVQYAGSPYVDYPILVCDPGEPKVYGDGNLFIIRQGPPGFRDVHLKRYFADQIRKKYRLWPNPDSKGWLWQGFDLVSGYDPRDAANLLPYVDEQPQPDVKEADPLVKEPSAEESLIETKRLAEMGDPEAQVDLAISNYHAMGTNPDVESYRLWIERAALSGSSVGETAYAQAILEGSLGQADAPKAIELLEQVVQKDNYDEAHLILGEVYYFGDGVEPDLPKAFGHFQKADEQGNRLASFMLGQMYFHGDHVSRDVKQAVKFYRAAAEANLAEANAALGYVFADGELGSSDYPKAIEFFKKSVQLDADPEVVAMLASIYAADHPGVAKNPSQSAELYLQAARSGHRESQVTIGDFYRDGFGVSKDPLSAYVWYKSGMLAGQADAVDKLNSLNRNMNDEQKTQAEAMFRQLHRGR